MDTLNKETSIPLYQQLAAQIKSQIDAGMLKENDKILTEIELSEKYNVSRITVRKAIELLVEDDILVKQQGKGTFVAATKLQRVCNGPIGFTQSCEIEGKKASSEVLKVDVIVAPISDIKKLNLKDGERVIRIVRLRKCDGIPVIIEENHFPMQYSFLLSEDLSGSIYEHLKKHGIVFNGGMKSIDICYATEEEARLLEVEPNQALILHKDYCSDQNGNPIQTCKQIINAVRYKMIIPL